MSAATQTTDPLVAARAEKLLADPAALLVTLDRYRRALGTLARLLAGPPTAYLLSWARDPELLDGWPLTGEDCRRGTALLTESAIAAERPAAVDRDHGRLFADPMKAPPYESAYCGDAAAVTVHAAYLPYGLPTAARTHEPDHIAAELAFAAELADRAATGLGRSDVALGRGDVGLGRGDAVAPVLHDLLTFLHEHLLVWAPRCLTRVANASTTFFYQGVAALGLGTLSAARTSFAP